MTDPLAEQTFAANLGDNFGDVGLSGVTEPPGAASEAAKPPERGSAARSGALILGSKAASAIVGVGLSVVLARALGTEGRADYFLVATLAAAVFAVCALSQDQAIAWALAEVTSNVRRVVRALIPIVASLAAGGAVVYLIVAFPVGVLSAVPRGAAIAGAVLVPLATIRLVLDGLLYASERGSIASFSALIAAVVQLIAVGVVWAVGNLDPTAVIVTSAIGMGAGILACGGALRQLMRDRPDRAGSLQPRDLVRVGLANHAGLIALWLALRADVFIVAALVSRDRLGVYTLALTLGEILLLMTDSLAQTAMGQQVSRSRKDGALLSVAVAADSARLAVVQFLGLVIVGWPLIRFVFGAEWVDAYPVLIALGPGLAGYAYLRPLGVAFVRAGRARERAIALGAAGLVNVFGTWLLVSRIGIIGGGIASTAGYLIGAGILASRSVESVGQPPWARSILLPRVISWARTTRSRSR